MVEIETWCQGEGRIGTRRDWILKDYATGQVIGRATRCAIVLLLISIENLKVKECSSYEYPSHSKISYAYNNLRELLSYLFFDIIYSLNCYFLEFYWLFIEITIGCTPEYFGSCS